MPSPLDCDGERGPMVVGPPEVAVKENGDAGLVAGEPVILLDVAQGLEGCDVLHAVTPARGAALSKSESSGGGSPLEAADRVRRMRCVRLVLVPPRLKRSRGRTRRGFRHNKLSGKVPCSIWWK